MLHSFTTPIALCGPALQLPRHLATHSCGHTNLASDGSAPPSGLHYFVIHLLSWSLVTASPTISPGLWSTASLNSVMPLPLSPAHYSLQQWMEHPLGTPAERSWEHVHSSAPMFLNPLILSCSIHGGSSGISPLLGVGHSQSCQAEHLVFSPRVPARC